MPDSIRSSGRHLLSIINDILDFSQIEAGRLVLESIDFSVAATLEQVRSLLTPQATERGLELTMSIDQHSPPVVRGDPTRLRQVLLNLVGNALKFTSTGWVRVHVGCGDVGHRASLRFEIQDTGIGITAEQQAELFQAFAQAEGSTARTYGGSGLGLAISKRLVEAMGGTIGVESELGRGSTFWFELALEVGDSVVAAERDAEKPASVPSLHILVAEDVPINRDLLQTVLTQQGHEVTMAENGEEAVRQASSTEFDVILMDVQMPVLDGIAAARQIRRLPSPAGKVPIIALTANVMAAEHDRCLEAGMSEVLTKPVAWPSLFAALAALAPTRRAASINSPGPADEELSVASAGATPSGRLDFHRNPVGRHVRR